MKALILTTLSILILFTGIKAYSQINTNQGRIIADNNPGGIIEAYELEKI